MNFVNFMAFNRTNKKCLLQNLSFESSTLICVGRSAIGVIPRAIAAVTENLCRLIPGPQFDQTVKPKIQMKSSNITVQGSNLLLTGTFNFLNITKVLLNGISVGNCFKNLDSRSRQVSTHKGPGAILAFPNNKHLDQAARWFIQGLENIHLFDFFFAIKNRIDLKPAIRIFDTIGKFNPFAIFTGSTSFAFSRLSQFSIKHGIFSQSGNDYDSHFDNRFKEAGPGKAAGSCSSTGSGGIARVCRAAACTAWRPCPACRCPRAGAEAGTRSSWPPRAT